MALWGLSPHECLHSKYGGHRAKKKLWLPEKWRIDMMKHKVKRLLGWVEVLSGRA